MLILHGLRVDDELVARRTRTLCEIDSFIDAY